MGVSYAFLRKKTVDRRYATEDVLTLSMRFIELQVKKYSFSFSMAGQ